MKERIIRELNREEALRNLVPKFRRRTRQRLITLFWWLLLVAGIVCLKLFL
jgi:hypothetical protein